MRDGTRHHGHEADVTHTCTDDKGDKNHDGHRLFAPCQEKHDFIIMPAGRRASVGKVHVTYQPRCSTASR